MAGKRVVALNGGGVESAAVLHALTEGYDTTSIFIRTNYPGNPAQEEAAAALANVYHAEHRVVAVDFGLDTSHLWGDGITLGPMVAWTPFLLSVGIAMARAVYASECWTGHTWVTKDMVQGFYAMIPQMPEWIAAFVMPFAGADKKAIAATLPRDVLDMTTSCFASPPCGVCFKCRERAEAISG